MRFREHSTRSRGMRVRSTRRAGHPLPSCRHLACSQPLRITVRADSTASGGPLGGRRSFRDGQVAHLEHRSGPREEHHATVIADTWKECCLVLARQVGMNQGAMGCRSNTHNALRSAAGPLSGGYLVTGPCEVPTELRRLPPRPPMGASTETEFASGLPSEDSRSPEEPAASSSVASSPGASSLSHLLGWLSVPCPPPTNTAGNTRCSSHPRTCRA